MQRYQARRGDCTLNYWRFTNSILFIYLWLSADRRTATVNSSALASFSKETCDPIAERYDCVAASSRERHVKKKLRRKNMVVLICVKLVKRAGNLSTLILLCTSFWCCVYRGRRREIVRLQKKTEERRVFELSTLVCIICTWLWMVLPYRRTSGGCYLCSYLI